MLVFNFHHVEAHADKAGRPWLTISPEGLARFIKTFRMLGFTFVSLKSALDTPEAFWADHDRKVVITFDDGYVNNYEYAWPVLEKMACPATFFVLPGAFGGTNEWDFPNLPESERDALMTLEHMQAMAKSPWVTFGSHGLKHRHLAQIPPDLLQQELHESYQILATHLGEAFLPIMAYPWGKYSSEVLVAMSNTPYKLGLTTNKGVWHPASDVFQVPRYTGFLRDGYPLILLIKLMRNGLWPKL
ncbi:MAG: polysaccharide deacetylase family protein [Vampirovibrionales bacterium]|nr:polysaccharide deacetylase family protein [Vampirovibrionales bacterium]